MFYAPRGTQDILPADRPYWRYVTEQMHAVAALFGLQQIDTPIFEEAALFVRGVGEGTDIVDKEMYTFQDKGGNELTLRPEFTAGVMRAYIEHGMHVLPQPVKLYSIGPIFRYERPQAGRYRQHHQFNVEMLGELDPAVDLEVMSVAWTLLTRLGYRGLSFQLNSTGCPVCRPAYRQALIEYFGAYRNRLNEVDLRRLAINPLRLLDSKEEAAQALLDGAPHSSDYLCDECAAHLATLRSYLDALEMPHTINFRLVRGLDYYTKTVFEVWAEGIGAQAAVCGGGRYDKLIEMLGGLPTPGIGFGMGIERIAMLRYQVDDIRLDIETALPLGLILNELLTNSYKHAFTEAAQGEIRIELSNTAVGHYRFAYHDNGTMKADPDKSGTSLGMRLIQQLTRQIHGTGSFSYANGYGYTIEFMDLEQRRRLDD